MKQRIDSTLYFFQYLLWRISLFVIIIMLIYSVLERNIGAVVFTLLGIILIIYVIKTKVTRPNDLKFNGDCIYLRNQKEPIKIDRIKTIENGVIIYRMKNEIIKISLPNYYFIDKNYRKLKKLIQSNSL